MSPVRWARRKSSSSESERNCYNVQTSQVTTERFSSKKDKKRIQEERRRFCEKRNPLLDKVKNTKLTFFKDRTTAGDNNDKHTDGIEFRSMRDLEQIRLTRNDFRRSVCELDLKEMTEDEKTQVKRKKRSKSHSRIVMKKINHEVNEELTNFRDFTTTSDDKSCWSNNECATADCTNIPKTVTDTLSDEPELTFDSVSSSNCLAAKFKAIQDRYFKTSTSRLIAKIYKKDGIKDRDSRRLRSFSYGTLPGLDELRTNPIYDDQEQDDNDSGILDNGSATSSLLDDRCGSGASGLITNTTTDTMSFASSPPLLPPKKSSFGEIEVTRNSIYQAANDELIQHTELNAEHCDSINVDISKQLPVIKSTVSTTKTMVVKLTRETADQSLGIFIAKTCDPNCGYLIAHVVPNALAYREGTLKIGDEILIVNGKRLRGLEMSEARKVVGCGGTVGDVDIVISRYQNIDKPKVMVKNKILKESSVDYENINIDSVNSTKLHFKKHSKHPRDRKNECNRSINLEKVNGLNVGSQSVSNFCTLPRKPRNSISTFHTVVFEKGPGKKSLGFTIVGGRDSPKGSIGIFIKSVLPGGQAAEDGRLRAGDEILAVNGQVSHDLTHREAIQLFRNIKNGPLALHLCRRNKQHENEITKAKSCADLLLEPESLTIPRF